MQIDKRIDPNQGKVKFHFHRAVSKGGLAIAKLIFSRIALTILVLLVQIYILVMVLNWMGEFAQWWLYLMNILAAVIATFIVNSNENPAFKTMWMIPLCVIPVFGAVLFIFIQANPARIGLKKGLNRRKAETEPYLMQNQAVIGQMKKEKISVYDLAYYIKNVNHFPAYTDTRVTYFSEGRDKIEDLKKSMEEAREFIFLEYFIINPGRVWDEILEILLRKVKEGVEVRVLYDGFNSIVSLPHAYDKKLQKMGINAKVFSPVKPFLSSHQNNRDHRKIAIIDGIVAYNGGVNLADEYANYMERFGYWKDTAVKLNGPAVKSFTAMFLQMWNMNEPGSENYDKYLRAPYESNRLDGLSEQSVASQPNVSSDELLQSETASQSEVLPDVESLPGVHGNDIGYVIPYNDDPTNGEDVAEEVYLDILNKAHNYVWIMTPYLIPENELITAIRFAAQRGVDVRIIMPHIPDKQVAFDIAHTYYPTLIEAGVKMYEFTPGFCHGKMFVSDDNVAVVGSINLDFRSLYEHYECATFIYGNNAVFDVKSDFESTFEKCQLFTMEDYKKLPILRRMRGRALRIWGPLM